MRQTIGLVLILLGGVAGPLHGQASEAPPFPVVAPGTWVRIRVAAAVPILGQLVQVTHDTLVLRQYRAGRRAVSIPRIEALWVRGHATDTGALTGAVVGLVGVAVYAFNACGGSGLGRVCVYTGALAGAGTGALAGALVGAAIPQWHRRY